ncbi:erv26 superfamily protein [Neofusicoccum ribis]|uniref:Erv26 superfamily protein n=1 Tax=Neofusicoccum ribis TaxID=45134 RepID=A0ABR3SEW5_9PEZI
MWVLPLVGYLGLVLGFGFLTLAIASGLYYLSELVEEHTVLAKKLLTRMIYAVMVLQLLLWLFDSFPLGLSILSILSHVVYTGNLRRFPIVKLTDPLFILSCCKLSRPFEISRARPGIDAVANQTPVLVLINHYLWFRHFSTPPPRTNYYPYNTGRDYSIPTFTEIASYFGLCVWLVPFALFVSLSAGENVLPSMGSEYATGEGSSFIAPGQEPSASASSAKKNNVGLAKALVDGVRDWVGETGEVMGFWRGDRVKRF